MGYIKDHCVFPTAALEHKQLPGHVRVLLCMMQGPPICWWSSAKIAAITGLTAPEVRVYRRRLVKAGLLIDMAVDGGKGYKVNMPPASDQALQGLSELSADQYANPTGPNYTLKKMVGPLEPMRDWDLVPFEPHYENYRKLLPFAVDAGTKDYNDFWSGVQRRVMAVMRRTKTTLPANLVTFHVLMWTVVTLKELGYPKKVNSPVAYAISVMNKFPVEELRREELVSLMMEELIKHTGAPALRAFLPHGDPGAVVPDAEGDMDPSRDFGDPDD